jgi:RNA polymerase sigma-70 factor (ECF subfamily)
MASRLRAQGRGRELMAAPNAALPRPLSDEVLVERLRTGDRRSFDILYERYFPRVYSFVSKRIGSRADIEETVQEVFINFFASIHGFRGEAPFAAWLFGLTRRTIAGRYKRKRHETVPLPESESDPISAATSQEPDPHENYECHERLEQMERSIRQDLTPEQRLLFQLHHLEDRSIQEIAQALEKSEDSVKSHLYRARKALLAR